MNTRWLACCCDVTLVPAARGITASTRRSVSTRFIDKYEIISTLGRGSMGVVYKGRDPEIGRLVAIKTLKAVFMGEDSAGTEALQRFRQESRSAGKLHHPNIVTIFEAGKTDSGSPYIVMEYIEGQSLETLLTDRGSFEPLAALHYLAQIANAVDYAHSQNVIHRDIKPSNIIVDSRHRPHLLDFGVAKLSDTSLTPAGTVVGTPSYMSPEQIRGSTLDSRTDLFSLAVVAFELFTGVRPFPGTDFTTVVSNIIHKEPLSFKEVKSDQPSELERVLRRALAKDRLERYTLCLDSVEAMAQAYGVMVEPGGLVGGYAPGMKLSDAIFAAKARQEISGSGRGISVGDVPPPPVAGEAFTLLAENRPVNGYDGEQLRKSERKDQPRNPDMGTLVVRNPRPDPKTTARINRPAPYGLKLMGGSLILGVLLGVAVFTIYGVVTKGWFLGGESTASADKVKVIDVPIEEQKPVIIRTAATEPPVVAHSDTGPKTVVVPTEVLIPAKAMPTPVVVAVQPTLAPVAEIPADVPLPAQVTPEILAKAADKELARYLKANTLDPKSLRSTVEEVGKRDSLRLLPDLVGLLSHPDFLVRVQVLKALQRSTFKQEPIVAEAVIQALNDREYIVRGFSAKVLADIHRPEARNALSARLAVETETVVIKVLQESLKQ